MKFAQQWMSRLPLFVSFCWLFGYYTAINKRLMFFFSPRGVQWGALCLHCSEHCDAAETEGNAHVHSKGQSVKTQTNALMHETEHVLLFFFLLSGSIWVFSFLFPLVKFTPPSARSHCIFFAAQNQSGAAWLYWLSGFVCLCASTERGLFNSWETGL